MTETSNVLAILRKMIIDGHIPPGEKLAEIPIAESLGVSRTPVRLAFRTLEHEGLLRRREKRGFVVREFTANDILCALEVRGALEGIAARRLAEKGVDLATREKLQNCVASGNDVLGKGSLVEEDIGEWSKINDVFHKTIIQASDSKPIADAIARNNHLPFASSDSLMIDIKVLDKEYQKLSLAQIHHQVILEAICAGEGARAEYLMREHAYVGLRYAKLFGIGLQLLES